MSPTAPVLLDGRTRPSVELAHVPSRDRTWIGVTVVSVLVGASVPGALARGPQAALALLAALLVLVLCTGGVRRVLVAVAVCSLPFQLGIAVAYREDAAAVGALGGAEVSMTTVAVLGLCGLWIADRLVGVDAPRASARSVRPFAAIVVVAAVAATTAVDAALAWYELVLLAEALLLLLYLSSWMRRPDERRFVVACFLLSGGAQAVLVIVGRFVDGVPGRTDPTLGSDVVRAGGTIGSPNTAGSFFAALLVFAVAVALAPGRERGSRAALLVAPLAAIALVLTGSRGAWIGTGVGAALVLVAAGLRGWVDAVRFVIGAWVAVAIALLLGGAVADRLSRDDGGALAGRGPLMEMTADVIAEHPVTGIGPNNLGPVLLEHPDARDPDRWVYTVHNKYLLVWAEAGPAALLALLWFLGHALARGIEAARSPDPRIAGVGVAAAAALVALAVQMNVESFSSRPQVHLLVLLAAMTAAAAAPVAEPREPGDA